MGEGWWFLMNWEEEVGGRRVFGLDGVWWRILMKRRKGGEVGFLEGSRMK